MNRQHEVIEKYNGTLESVHHFMSATDIATNDSITFHNSKCYETRLIKMSLVGAMEMKSPTTRLETTGRFPPRSSPSQEETYQSGLVV